MTLTVGTRVGGYEVASMLGRGGMGEVYRAHDPKLRRMNLLNINANWQPLVTGVVILLAAWIDIVTRRRIEAQT